MGTQCLYHVGGALKVICCPFGDRGDDWGGITRKFYCNLLGGYIPIAISGPLVKTHYTVPFEDKYQLISFPMGTYLLRIRWLPSYVVYSVSMYDFVGVVFL